MAGTLYLYSFLDEFVLLYPVYTLLFMQTGLSVAETTSLLVIWAVTGLVLEVPSGALADVVSRRLLLCVGPLLAATGFALWVIFPSYWVFAAGFVLWGVRGALTSGSMEALVYEELERVGAAGRYAGVMGRATSVGLAATASAIGLATPVSAVGGYLAVGAASVVACLLCSVTALAFPEHRGSTGEQEEDDDDEPGYWTALKSGLSEARRNRQVSRWLVMSAVAGAIWGALEEYIPYLGTEIGVPLAGVPLLVLLVWTSATAGGLLAERAGRLTERRFALMLLAAALALAGGALSGQPAGFALIALAFGVFQLADVVADARLQASIDGPSRATVTSVAGLGREGVTLLVYLTYGIASTMASHGLTFALLALPYAIVALGWRRKDPRP